MISVCLKCGCDHVADAPICIACQRNGAHVYRGTACHCPGCNKPARELALLAKLRHECHELMLGDVDREMAEMQCGNLVIEAMERQREVVIV